MQKQQKKRNLKGFTLVELSIVIAVIAILIAVLVPTFISLINSANESSDKQLVKNLNTAITTEDPTGETQVISEALEIAQDNGYIISKISPTSDGYDIVWDETSNRFVLMNGTSVVYSDSATDTANMNLWYITSSNTILTDKNYYYSADSGISGEVTVSSGADLSALTGVTKITVNASSAKSTDVISVVVPETALVVNNDNSATINVYGSATTISTETTYGGESLHVYGTVTNKIDLSKGRVVAETGSTIASIIVTATDISNIEIEAKSSTSVKSVGATDSDVAAALSGSSYISGVSTSTIVSTAVSNEFAGGTGTAASPYQIATAEQFAEIGEYSEKMENGTAYYFELIDDIDLSTYTLDKDQITISAYFCGTLNGNNKTLITNDGLSYVLGDAVGTTVIENVNYKLNYKNINLIGGQAVRNAGNHDLTIDNVDVSTVTEKTIITIGQNQGIILGWVGITATGLYVDTNSSYNTDYTRKVTIQNCDVDLYISGDSYNAVFIGGGVYCSTAVVKDCTYSGRYIGEAVNLALGNSQGYSDRGVQELTITNVVNNGYMAGTSRIPLIAGGNSTDNNGSGTEASWAKISGCYIGTSSDEVKWLTDSSLELNTNNGSLVVTAAADPTTSYYVISIYTGRLYVNSSAEISSYFINIKIDKANLTNAATAAYTDGVFVTQSYFNDNIIGSNTVTYTSVELYDNYEGATLKLATYNGILYYVFDFGNNGYYFYSNTTTRDECAVEVTKATVTAYDEKGLPIATDTQKLETNYLSD